MVVWGAGQTVGNTLICRGVSRDAHQSGPEPELLSAHRLLPRTPKATYPNNTEQTDGERACFATGLRPHVVRDHERPACLRNVAQQALPTKDYRRRRRRPTGLWGQIYNLSPISSAYAENTTCSRRSGAGATSSYLTARKFLQRIPRDWPVSQFRILPGARFDQRICDGMQDSCNCLSVAPTPIGVIYDHRYWEHLVAVTDTGCEVLDLREGEDVTVHLHIRLLAEQVRAQVTVCNWFNPSIAHRSYCSSKHIFQIDRETCNRYATNHLLSLR